MNVHITKNRKLFWFFWGMKSTGPRWTSAQSRVWTGFATVGVQARLFDKVNWFCSFAEWKAILWLFFASTKSSTYDIYKLTCLGKKRNFFSSIHLSPMFVVFSQHFYIFLFSPQFPARKRRKKTQLKAQKLKALMKSEDLQASKAATGGLTRGLYAVVSPRTIGMWLVIMELIMG